MGQHTRFPRVLMRAMPLAALIAGIWLPSLALGAVNNEGLKLVPFTINVNSKSSVELYVYIQGEVAEQTATLPPATAVYVSNLQGDVTIIPTCPNPPAGCSLALDLGSQPKTQMMLPRLRGMRLYFSINQPFLINSSQIGVLPDILGGGWTPGGENYNTIFDFAELDWQNRRFGGNVSEVDMFGIPMLLQMTGTNPGNNQPVTLNAGFTEQRSTLIGAYMALGAPWTNLIVPSPSGGAPLRVIAPYHGIALGTFPSTILDSYINSVFSNYTTQMMFASAENHNYTATTATGNLVFSEAGVPKFQFTKPNTLTVYQNEIYSKTATLISTEPRTSERAGVVAAALGGAYMRSVLLVNPNLMACQVSQFYANPPTNLYAKLWHQFSFDQKAYAYGYDDTCSQSSYIALDDPTNVSMTLNLN